MGLFSGITKSLFGSGGDKSAKQAVQTLQNLKTPEIADMEVELQSLVQQGVMTPEEAQAALVDASAYEGISLDPNLKASQMDALASLQEIGDGGMTAMDRAQMGRIISDEQTASRGARDAIIQNANARGVGGSGLELAAQLQNQQDSASRASQRGLDVAAQAQERALQAIMQSGQLAGNIRGQDMDEQSKIASAKDQIAQFNAQNKQQTNLVNTGARNDAQASNLANKQNIANQNVANRNQQEMYNKGLVQQDFNNKLSKATGTANQLNNLASQQNANRAGDMNLAGGIIGAGASMYNPKKAKDGGLVGGEPSNEDTEHYMLQPGEMVVKKDDVPEYLKKRHTSEDGDFDVASFLDDITGGKYGYSSNKKGA